MILVVEDSNSLRISEWQTSRLLLTASVLEETNSLSPSIVTGVPSEVGALDGHKRAGDATAVFFFFSELDRESNSKSKGFGTFNGVGKDSPESEDMIGFAIFFAGRLEPPPVRLTIFVSGVGVGVGAVFPT